MQKFKGLDYRRMYLEFRPWLVVITLVLIYAAAVLIRIDIGTRGDNQYFSSETALQFYYARLVAQGQSIPEVDYKAQYPEGLRVRETLSVFMEYLVGGTFRILEIFAPAKRWVEGIGFEKFTRSYTPFFISFSVIAVFLCGRMFCQDRKLTAPFIAALFYAVVLPAANRGSGWEFLKENFSLPFIFFHIYFFLRAVSCPRRYFDSAVSGVCLGLAFAAWHLAQFYYVILISFVWLLFIGEKDIDRRHIIFRVFEIITLCVFCVGVSMPYLRAVGFVFSYPMIVSYSLIFARLTAGKLKSKESAPALNRAVRFILWLGITICLAVVFNLIKRENWSGAYSHVLSVLFYKLIYLWQKPLDPAKLPYEVRQLWVPPFLSPSLNYLINNFSMLLIPFLAGVWFTIKQIKKEEGVKNLYFIYLSICFLLFFICFSRLVTSFIFVVCVFAGLGINLFREKSAKFRPLYLGGISCVLILELAGTLSIDACRPVRLLFKTPAVAENKGMMVFYTLDNAHEELLEWIKKNTAQDAVFLAHCSTSPRILAYAGRTIVLQSKFEEKHIRQKVDAFLKAVFGTEEELYGYCRGCGVDYLVYTADTFLDDSLYGWRYMAGRMNIDESDNAYKLHFRPEELRSFKLVYQNGYYRVYKVIYPPEDSEAVPESGEGGYLIYNEGLFKKWGLSASGFAGRINEVHKIYLVGLLLESQGNESQAVDYYRKVVTMVPEFELPKQRLKLIRTKER